MLRKERRVDRRRERVCVAEVTEGEHYGKKVTSFVGITVDIGRAL
jgi:hypothetical protein